MALSALDKVYSSRIKAIDERIEETLEEIDRYLKNGTQKDLTKRRKSSLYSLENSSVEQSNTIRDGLQKMLNFCHDEPGAVEALFNTIKKVAQHSLPFQAACDCGICTDCLEEGCSNRNCHARQQSRSGDAAKDTPPELQKPVSEEIKVLWCSLCYHVQAFITQQLISNAKVLFTKHGFVQDTNWESYFEMLRFLFVVGQVQRIHQWVRSEQLRRASCPCETSASSSSSSSCCIICLIQWSVQSLARDVAMRPSLEMTWHDLSDCYVDAVRSRVTACLQELWNRWHNRNATGEDKRGFSPCLANPRSCWAHSGANDSGTKSTVRTEDGVDSQNACSDWSDRRLVTAVVTLVAELYWFEQQLNGISCRTWAVLSKSPQQPSADGMVTWDEPCAWDWRQVFASSGVLTMLQQSIQELIQMKPPHSRGDTVTVELDGSKLRVSAAAFHAISCLEVYEPAVRACQGVLGPFRASFIHAVHVALGRAADSLEAELRQKDRLARNFYVMLNTGSYLSCAVLRFTAALSGKNEGLAAAPFHGLHQRVTSALRHAEKLILLHHLKWLSGCIAPSTDSEQDFKRACALSLYVSALGRELKYHVGYTQCGCLLRLLFSEILRQVTPLHMVSREPELKLVLRSAYEALFLMCNNTQELLGVPVVSPSTVGPVAEVHSHCNTLLTVVTAKGRNAEQQQQPGQQSQQSQQSQQQSQQQQQQQPHQQAPWLCWVEPSLFTGPPWAQLPANTRIWLPLALCMETDVPQPMLLLQCLTAAEGTLSTLLASQVASQIKAGEAAAKEQRFLDALFGMLVLCDYHEGLLNSVLVSVIEKLDGWREFEYASLGKDKSERAWWYRSVQGLLTPYLKSVVASLATPILRRACEKNCTLLHQIQDEIWQHCKASSQLQDESPLVDLLSCTMAVVPTFPAPLLACLTRLGKLVTQVGVLSTNNSSGLQMLLSSLHDILKCPDELEELFGARLDSKTSLECAHIADEMVALALQLSQPPESEASANCETGSDDQRAANSLHLLTSLLCTERDMPWEESLSQTAEDITLGLVAEHWLKTPQGPEDVGYLHAMLHQNEAWIRHTLAIPFPNYHSAPVPSKRQLDLDISWTARQHKFNPLEAYAKCLQLAKSCETTQSP